MARFFVGDSGGSARLAKRVFVGDSGGTARLAQRIFVGDSGGVARLIFQYLTVTMVDVNVTSGGFATCITTLTINSAGTYAVTASGDSITGTDSGTWMTIGANTDFEVRLSGTGDTPTGSAFNTWLATTSNRSWTLTTTGSGDNKSLSGTLEFRAASGGAVLSTKSVFMNLSQL